MSPEIKKEILKKYFGGEATKKMLERDYRVSFNTIKTWIRTTKKGIDVTINHRKEMSKGEKQKI